jgi:hypothetical protein
VIRFAISPIIVVLIGAVVGFLSKDHPVLITVLGMSPWTVMLLASPHRPTTFSAWAFWFSPLFVYLPLAATAAWLPWRCRSRASSQSSQLS